MNQRTLEQWFDHFRKAEPTASSRLLAACEELVRHQKILDAINMMACFASEEDTSSREQALLEIGKLARGERVPQA